jgi:uncharacterized protein YecE (DUF72 family)
MSRFLSDTTNLGGKLGLYLVQLPPSHVFDKGRAQAFFERIWDATNVDIVCEPRHRSWFERTLGNLLTELKIGRVAADPPPEHGADSPGGWEGVIYYRLHGSPRMYYDSYAKQQLTAFAERLRSTPGDSPVWCIFNNTARGAGTENALYVWEVLDERGMGE